MLCAGLGVIVWLAYVALAGLFSGGMAVLFGAGAALSLVLLVPFVAIHLPELLRALSNREAVVILDASGVTDLRKKDAFISWEDVGQVSLGSRQQVSSYLILDFRSDQVARSRSQGRLTFFSRLALSLGDWHVNLRPLKCKPAEVLRIAKRLHQESIRRQVIARNGSSLKGWSGKL